MSLKRAAVQGDNRWQFGAGEAFLRQNGASLGIPAKTVNRRGPQSAINQQNQYEMLDGARRLLNDKKTVSKDDDEFPVFKFRVAVCHRNMMDTTAGYYTNAARTKGEWRGIQRCGSVWHCPMCAKKVSSKRRDWMNALIAAHKAGGGEVYLLTYTHSHDNGSLSLAEQLARMQRAYRRLCNHRDYKKLIASAGNLGAVRAMEVTHGIMNGWHPHYHVLIFLNPGAHWLLMRIRRLWMRELIEGGLSGLRGCETPEERRKKLFYLKRRALDVRGGAFAAEYVAKFGVEPATEAGGSWGLGSEMTKGHIKNDDRFKGRTPFTLLAIYVSGKMGVDARWAGELFREYALAFNAKRQLVSSSRLRSRLIASVEKNLSLDMFERDRLLSILRKEKTDRTLAMEPADRCDVKAATLMPADWHNILMHQKRGDFEAHILAGGEARKYLDWLAGLDPPVFGRVYALHENLLDRRRLPPGEPSRFIMSPEVYAIHERERAERARAAA